MAYNDDRDPYDVEYDAMLNPSERYEMESDYSYMGSLDHFRYGTSDDD